MGGSLGGVLVAWWLEGLVGWLVRSTPILPLPGVGRLSQLVGFLTTFSSFLSFLSSTPFFSSEVACLLGWPAFYVVADTFLARL